MAEERTTRSTRRAPPTPAGPERGLETQPDPARLLRDLSIRLIASCDVQALYEQMLDVAAALVHADSAALYTLQPGTDGRGVLCLTASRGLHPESARFWGSVPLESSSAWMKALRSGERIVVGDTEQSDLLANTMDLDECRRSGIRSGQSTPLVSRSGRLLGVVSTHWHRPYVPTDDDLLWMDILARQAADFIEHRKGEEALREAEERFRSLIRESPDGIVVLDSQGRVLEWNEGEEAITGLSRAQVVGRPMWEVQHDLVPEERRADVSVHAYREKIVAGMAEGMRLKRVLEDEIQRSDGTRRVIQSVLFAIRSNETVLPCGICRDITERRRREVNLTFLAEVGRDLARLSSAEEIVRTVGEKTGAYLGVKTLGFCQVDNAGSEITIEYAWQAPDVPGLQGAYRISKHFSEAFRHASRAGETIVIHDTSGDARVDGQRFRALGIGSFVGVPCHMGGKWNYFLAATDSHPRQWQPDEIELFHALANRVFPRLQRARAEEALRASEERYRALAELSPDATVVNQDGRYVYANAAAARLFGVGTPEELIGRTPFEVIAAGYHDRVRERLRHVVEQGAPTPLMEDEWQRLDGSLVPVEVAAGPINWNGKPAVQAVARDITERKRAEQALLEGEERLRRYNEELEARVLERTEQVRQLERQRAALEQLAAAGRVAARVAHEINNPLAGIKNAFLLLKDGIPNDYPYYSYVPRVQAEIDRIASIVKQMFQLVRPPEDDGPYATVATAIRDVVAIQHLACEKRGITLDTRIEPSCDLNLPGNPIRQILFNLVQNAMDATPDGGTVRVHAAATPQGAIEIAVSDEGAGIPEARRPFLFEPFYTTKDAHKNSGLGLGLSISKSLAESLGGTLDFSTTVGEGTTFVLTLPLRTPPLPEEGAR